MQSFALAMLLHIRSLAGYIIDMLVSSFWKRHLQDRRKPSIQLNKEQAIAVRKPDAPMHHPAQHNHLISERSIFGFKSGSST